MSTIPDLDTSNIHRVLVVVAHPDDAEYGLSAAVSLWTDTNITVDYLLLTKGEAGIRHLPPEKCAPIRRQEQQAACDTVGVQDLTMLNFPDGQLVYSLELRKAIAKHIRQRKPDTVIIANFDVEAYGSYNQADHRVAGLATIDAVRDADNPWLFTDLGLATHKATRMLVANSAEPTHRQTVDEAHVAKGIKSLACHKVYFEALPDHPAAEEFIPMMLQQDDGAKAVLFRVFDPV
ncbi:PIG-L deacetylase family protein [Corynebacterium ulceribovis]|uniref:PIG-L deacetylase family protein n=1 Tax=Corynebacterium ulceribovis TaxID=487732 RepID=UPI0003615EB6|nr:PIG-L deacetylase family protein [Corynebacterium ulceribovis]